MHHSTCRGRWTFGMPFGHRSRDPVACWWGEKICFLSSSRARRVVHGVCTRVVCYRVGYRVGCCFLGYRGLGYRDVGHRAECCFLGYRRVSHCDGVLKDGRARIPSWRLVSLDSVAEKRVDQT